MKYFHFFFQTLFYNIIPVIIENIIITITCNKLKLYSSLREKKKKKLILK
jgi:hypothetical protein